jgi:hypothetical protein
VTTLLLTSTGGHLGGEAVHDLEDALRSAAPGGDGELEADEDRVTVHDHLDEAERLLGGVRRDRPGDPAAASALAWWWDTRWALHEQLLAAAEDDFDG